MNKYDENSSCSKCGSTSVRTTWLPHDESRWLQQTIRKEVRLKCEHIRRTCERCYYMWVEAPLDAVEGGKDEGHC
jgi:hypothetical protein